MEQKHFRGLTAEADKFLLNYNWEGNVRQLQHLIHNVVVLNNAKMVTKAMFQASLDEELNQTSLSEAATIRPFSQLEKEAITEAVNFCEGNVKQAAKLLGLAPATVYRKLEKYNIKFKRMVKSS